MHDEIGFFRNAAGRNHGLDVHAIAHELVIDRLRAERRRFHERAEDFRGRRAEREAENRAFQRLIRERRPPPVQPIQRNDAAFFHWNVRGFVGKFRNDLLLDFFFQRVRRLRVNQGRFRQQRFERPR